MQEIPEGFDILFLTNAAYIQNFDKAPTSKSANRTSSESKDASSLTISAETKPIISNTLLYVSWKRKIVTESRLAIRSLLPYKEGFNQRTQLFVS